MVASLGCLTRLRGGPSKGSAAIRSGDRKPPEKRWCLWWFPEGDRYRPHPRARPMDGLFTGQRAIGRRSAGLASAAIATTSIATPRLAATIARTAGLTAAVEISGNDNPDRLDPTGYVPHRVQARFSEQFVVFRRNAVATSMPFGGGCRLLEAEKLEAFIILIASVRDG